MPDGRPLDAITAGPSGDADALAGRAAAERPRERLLAKGAAALSDQELLAVVLGAGIRHRDALRLAADVLVTAGDLPGLAQTSPARLMRTRGVGETRASRLVAAVELGRRAVAGPRVTRPRLATPGAVGAYLLPRHSAHPEERFGVVLLDTRHRLLRVVTLTQGTLDASVVHPREVFRAAAEHSAAAVVVFHNHPSGDPTPSVDDIQLTRRLVDAGELMGIGVVDHVVLGDACWHSLRDTAPGLFRR